MITHRKYVPITYTNIISMRDKVANCEVSNAESGKKWLTMFVLPLPLSSMTFVLVHPPFVLLHLHSSSKFETSLSLFNPLRH